MVGSGQPSIWSIRQPDGTYEDSYHPFGNDQGIEPLIIHQDYQGNQASSIEISQEFRLYHNLFHDFRRNRHLQFDEGGNESVAIRYSENRVEIRTDLLLQFCAIKQIALAIYIDAHIYSNLTLEELGLEEDHGGETGELFTYHYNLQDCQRMLFGENDKTLSTLLGKKYVLPSKPPDPHEEPAEHFHEFIIGKKPIGELVYHHCNHRELDNNFGNAPDAARYLTPVFFRTEVLAKYYANPDKYTVEDGCIRGGGGWILRLDNDHEDYVVVWLGDLGRDLPEAERAYWQSFNIPPEERKISKTCHTRAVVGWFANPTRADLVFKQEYGCFREDFRKAMGWDFFLQLHDSDEYCFKSLHTPLSENGAEFDDQLINLSKLLVDSLNEAELTKLNPTDTKDERGITKLETFLKVHGHDFALQQIAFLRTLQSLRSTSAAHRKGSKYDKVISKLDLKDRGYVRTFDELLGKAISFISDLRKAFSVPEREAPPLKPPQND